MRTRSRSWGEPISLRSLLKGLLLAALVLAAIVLLPLSLAVLAVIALITLFVLLDAAGNRILFTMSLRNIRRRPSTTALVLGGLMVGTAIISASLVVGDTLDNMIVGEVVDSFGDVDFVVRGPGEGVGNTGVYELDNVSLIRDAVRDLHSVDGADWVLQGTVSMKDMRSNLTSPGIDVMGLTDRAAQDLGGFRTAGGSQLSAAPSAAQAYVVPDLAARLDIADGDTLLLVHDQTHIATATAVLVSNAGLGGLGPDMFLDLGVLQPLSAQEGMVSSLMVSLDQAGRQDVGVARETLNSTLSAAPELGLEIARDRDQAIVDGRSSVSMFTSLFFVFGSFSIIAGIALIINIFTMLGEERKGEMGMARAVGMRRGHLQRLFTYEGWMYASLASVIGTLAGLLLAYMLILAATAVIDQGGLQIDRYFTFTPLSLALAYLVGFTLTLATVYLVTLRISKLNIVRAVRNIPEPPRPRNDRGLMRLGIALLALGAAITLVGMDQESLAAAQSGLSLATLSVGLLLRKFTGDRIAWTVAGAATLVLWLPTGVDVFPYEGNIEMFVIAGVFMVVSTLIVVMFNSGIFIRVLTRLLPTRGGYGAVMMTAISYPLRARVRTALSVFIFGLVIFTITTLSMISGMMGVGIPKIIDQTSGGFDVLAYSGVPVDMLDGIRSTDGLVEEGNVTSIVQLSMARPLVAAVGTQDNITADAFGYSVIGVEERLYTEGHYPLREWDPTYGTEREVWDAVRDDPSLAIVDGSAGQNQSRFGMGFGSSDLAGTAVGDDLRITDPQGTNATVRVVGIMKQSTFSGVFMQQRYVNEELEVNGTNLFLIKLAAGADADRQAVLLQNQFWEYGVSTVPLKSLARDVVSQIDGIFNLIKAFLALGLIIGITGLGIITIRSIRERSIEIGMMRAIGYTRRMVVTNFALESAFVAVLGITIGTVLGMVVGYQLWDSAFRDMEFDFVIAWVPILAVGVVAFLATLLSVYPAARGASKVSPAEVLRFE